MPTKKISSTIKPLTAKQYWKKRRQTQLERNQDISPWSPHDLYPEYMTNACNYKEIHEHLYYIRANYDYYPEETDSEDGSRIPGCLNLQGNPSTWLLTLTPIAFADSRVKARWKGTMMGEFGTFQDFWEKEPLATYQRNRIGVFCSKADSWDGKADWSKSTFSAWVALTCPFRDQNREIDYDLWLLDCTMRTKYKLKTDLRFEHLDRDQQKFVEYCSDTGRPIKRIRVICPVTEEPQGRNLGLTLHMLKWLVSKDKHFRQREVLGGFQGRTYEIHLGPDKKQTPGSSFLLEKSESESQTSNVIKQKSNSLAPSRVNKLSSRRPDSVAPNIPCPTSREEVRGQMREPLSRSTPALERGELERQILDVFRREWRMLAASQVKKSSSRRGDILGPTDADGTSREGFRGRAYEIHFGPGQKTLAGPSSASEQGEWEREVRIIFREQLTKLLTSEDLSSLFASVAQGASSRKENGVGTTAPGRTSQIEEKEPEDDPMEELTPLVPMRSPIWDSEEEEGFQTALGLLESIPDTESDIIDAKTLIKEEAPDVIFMGSVPKTEIPLAYWDSENERVVDIVSDDSSEYSDSMPEDSDHSMHGDSDSMHQIKRNNAKDASEPENHIH